MMKRLFLVLVLLAGFGGPAYAIDIQVVKSDSGVTAWLVEEHSLPLVTMAAAFRGGAATDPDGKEGLANMISGLLDEGAGDLDSAAFQEKLQDKAINLRFDADAETFTASLRTLSEFSGEAFDLLGLALTAPRFDADAVERIRRQILVNLKEEEKDPNWQVRTAWQKAYFGDHPYAKPVEGTAQSIAAIGKADMEAFVKARLARDNLFVAVVGDVTAEQLKADLDKAFGKLPEKAAPFAIPEATGPQKGETIRIASDVPQAVVRFGEKGLLRHDPDWYSAYVMNYILGGGGFASRLMNVVRDKNGLAYGVGTGLSAYDHAGLLLGSVATARDSVDKSKALIEEEIAKMAKGDITKEELDAAKSYLTGSYPLSFDSSRKIASQLLGVQVENLGLDYIEKRNNLIEAVTLEDVNAAARRLLKPDNLLWVIVGGPADAKGS